MRLDPSADRKTQMALEIDQIPDCVAQQLDTHLPHYIETGRRLRRQSPRAMATVARGSSDCAASFLKHLVESRIGIPVASVGPSLSSIYRRPLQLSGMVSWAISQSGASDDINVLQASNRLAGALSISLVNSPQSCLEQNSDIVLPVGAGPELALPATKSFVCSLVAIAAVVAEWCRDADLALSLKSLPDIIEQSARTDWENVAKAFSQVESAIVLGRGIGFAIACEAALKLKETSYIFAEAFSAAEVWHGPAALLVPERPVVLFAQSDGALPGVLETAQKARSLGVRVFVVGRERTVDWLPVPETPNSVLESIAMISRFYRLAECIAGSSGINVDSPRSLKKVTVTV